MDHGTVMARVHVEFDQVRIQIQIQIESLHTRLDEASEMTNTGGIPAGPFLSTCTMREPRAMLAASHSPSARAKPWIKGGELQ